MDKSDPKNIIKKHYRKLNKIIKIVNEHFETESIHQLRVEYKKLRAFLRMISEEKDSGQKIKIPGKLKKAYHIAGSIRDLQLQCENIFAITKEETKKPESYLNLLQKEIKKLQPRFSNIPLEKAITESVKKADELLSEEMSTIHPGKFINNNCTAIIAIIISRNFTDVNMHAIRKHLKDIFYTIQKPKDVNQEIKLYTPGILNTEKKYFDELLEEFGNLQDKVTSLILLQEQWLHSLNTSDRQILFRIKRNIAIDKKKIRSSIINKLLNEIIPHLQVFKNVDIKPANININYLHP
jgi:CHAD domain-containing protein